MLIGFLTYTCIVIACNITVYDTHYFIVYYMLDTLSLTLAILSDTAILPSSRLYSTCV